MDSISDNYMDLRSALVKSLHLEDHYGQYLFGTTPISEDDVLHLLSRTERMKSYGNTNVKWERNKCTPISPSVYLRLYKYLNGTPLTPSLEMVVVDMSHESVTSEYIQELELTFPLIVNPSLQHVEIDGIQHWSQPVTVAILLSLPDEAPQVRKLILRGTQFRYRDGSLSTVVLSSCLKKMEFLEYLELNEIVRIDDSTMLKLIGELPNLTTFILRDSSHMYCNKGDFGKGFKKLEKLHVSGCIELVSGLVHHVGTSSMKSCECFPAFGGGYKMVGIKAVEYLRLPENHLYDDHIKMLKELMDYIPRTWPELKLNIYTVTGRSHDATANAFYFQFLRRIVE